MKVTGMNVVLAIPPAGPGQTYDDLARPLATFYAELLGMHIRREDWFIIAKSSGVEPHLAFGAGPNEGPLPRWPDPDHPQQLHLDLPVADLDAADDLALRLGATRLQDQGDYRSYADPAGHPFCFYRSESADAGDRPLTGDIGRVVIDCLSPRALASFYAELLDMPRRELDTPERVVISGTGPLPALAFQHAVFPAPRWPDPAYPQQVHLDLFVDDGAAAQELALRLGAIRLPDSGGSCPVYADPSGHPFCLCAEGQ